MPTYFGFHCFHALKNVKSRVQYTILTEGKGNIITAVTTSRKLLEMRKANSLGDIKWDKSRNPLLNRKYCTVNGRKFPDKARFSKGTNTEL